MKNFNQYAQYYDVLYQDKDYKHEVAYVDKLIRSFAPKNEKTVLELGCGTGKHAGWLSKKGYNVFGIDRSSEMIKIAKKNHGNDPDLFFQQGDIRNFNINKKFPIAISLFHVMSYQIDNSDIEKVLDCVKKHLLPNGIFIFDFWYGPGVLTSPPSTRIKKSEDELNFIQRTTNPVIYSDKNFVKIDFECMITDKRSGHKKKIREIHEMRYFFLPELHYYLNNKGLKIIQTLEWMNDKKAPAITSWNACVIARK